MITCMLITWDLFLNAPSFIQPSDEDMQGTDSNLYGLTEVAIQVRNGNL